MTDTTDTSWLADLLDGPVPTPAIDNTPTEEMLLGTVADLQAQLDRATRQLAAVISEHVQRIEDITDRLHEEANQRDFCSDFDDVMEELGLRRRSAEYEVTFEVTVRVTATVEAPNEDVAGDLAAEDFDSGRLQDYDYDVVSEEVVNVERA